MTTQTIGRRVTISRDFYGITVEIKSPLQIFSLILLPVWLCVWAFGVISAIKAQINGQTSLGLIIWLAGWFCGGCFWLYGWLWLAFGKEIITIEGQTLKMKRAILGLGITRATPVRESSHLRISQPVERPASNRMTMEDLGLKGETMAIDFGGKAHRFGLQLDMSEAEAIVKELQPYFPQENSHRGDY